MYSWLKHRSGHEHLVKNHRRDARTPAFAVEGEESNEKWIMDLDLYDRGTTRRSPLST